MICSYLRDKQYGIPSLSYLAHRHHSHHHITIATINILYYLYRKRWLRGISKQSALFVAFTVQLATLIVLSVSWSCQHRCHSLESQAETRVLPHSPSPTSKSRKLYAERCSLFVKSVSIKTREEKNGPAWPPSHLWSQGYNPRSTPLSSGLHRCWYVAHSQPLFIPAWFST